MTATILRPKWPSAPCSFTGAEPAPLLDDALCTDIEHGIMHCLTALHVEQLELHCIKTKQLLDLLAERYSA